MRYLPEGGSWRLQPWQHLGSKNRHIGRGSLCFCPPPPGFWRVSDGLCQGALSSDRLDPTAGHCTRCLTDAQRQAFLHKAVYNRATIKGPKYQSKYVALLCRFFLHHPSPRHTKGVFAVTNGKSTTVFSIGSKGSGKRPPRASGVGASGPKFVGGLGFMILV